MIRRRLLIFSFAAPLGAVITFFLVKAFGWGGAQHGAHEVDSLGWWTGIALLFSVSVTYYQSAYANVKGGSFLYVATVIQPLQGDSHAQGSHASGHAAHEETPELGKYQRTVLLIVGMLGPVFLSWIVGDAH
jgi:zinc transporter 9